jgi:hypothetical protein
MRMTITLSLFVSVCLIYASEVNGEDKEKWTNIKGVIRFDPKEKIPEPVEIMPIANQAACKANGKFYTEDWIIHPKNRGLKNVFVWIEPDGVERGTPFPKESIHPKLTKLEKKEVEIDQPCCQFIPHTLAVREGQTVIIKNSAPMPHNALWVSEHININPLIQSKGSHELKNVKAERDKVILGCNLHPFMKAHIRIFDHPYYTITDENGKFEIPLAPQGKYRLFIQHDTGWNKGREGNKGTLIDIKGATLDLKEINFESEKKKK